MSILNLISKLHFIFSCNAYSMSKQSVRATKFNIWFLKVFPEVISNNTTDKNNMCLEVWGDVTVLYREIEIHRIHLHDVLPTMAILAHPKHYPVHNRTTCITFRFRSATARTKQGKSYSGCCSCPASVAEWVLSLACALKHIWLEVIVAASISGAARNPN